MKLEILILTQNSRKQFLAQLMSLLDPQIHSTCWSSQVAVRTKFFDEGHSLGENRERMRQESTAQHIAFLDDDDLIAPNYISSIVPALTGVDQVSFDVQMFHNGRPLKIAKHSLAHKGWREDKTAYYRDISHVTPMRRELALSVPMSGGFGEDFRWANAMRGKVKTENHVNEALYFYLNRAPKNDAMDYQSPQRLALIEQLKGVPV